MKKLLILFFLLLFPTLCIAGFNHENFVYGTMSSDPLLAADTTGNTFTLELATNSERLPAGLVRLVIYSASCSQPSSCANREIIDIDSGVEPIYCTTGPLRVCTATTSLPQLAEAPIVVTNPYIPDVKSGFIMKNPGIINRLIGIGFLNTGR